MTTRFVTFNEYGAPSTSPTSITSRREVLKRAIISAQGLSGSVSYAALQIVLGNSLPLVTSEFKAPSMLAQFFAGWSGNNCELATAVVYPLDVPLEENDVITLNFAGTTAQVVISVTLFYEAE